ncbi:MAG: hypothetical protein QXM75_02955 [Candidatus Diapherotrites archaeon]
MLFTIPLEVFQSFTDFGSTTVQNTGETIKSFVGKPEILVFGIVFLIATIFIIFFIKKIIINSVLGLIAWAIITYFIGIELPFFAGLIISAIFGLAGVGTLLLLKFFGII